MLSWVVNYKLNQLVMPTFTTTFLQRTRQFAIGLLQAAYVPRKVIAKHMSGTKGVKDDYSKTGSEKGSTRER